MLWFPSKPATLVPGSPAFRRVMADPAWRAEPKMDGARCLAWLDGGRAVLTSRHGRPIDGPPAPVLAELAGILRPGEALDGELLHVGAWAARPRYVAFDVPVSGGHPSPDPLAARRDRLEALLAGRDGDGTGAVVLSEHVSEGKDAFLAACLERPGCEGIVLKHAASGACLDARRCRVNPGWWRVKP